MNLIEYLYIDSRRLDSYVNQIGPPVVYEKVPTLSAEIGLTGPKAAIGQGRITRERTIQEKVIKLIEHLEENDLLLSAQSKWMGWGLANERPQVFVRETRSARRVIIPAKPEFGESFRGLALWLSINPAKDEEFRSEEHLFLLEDFRSDDGRIGVITASAYSVISALSTYCNSQYRKTVIYEGTDDPSRELRSRFFNKPLKAFEELHCNIGSPRQIDVLYRIRALGKCKEQDVVYGYPIFIAELHPEIISEMV